MVALNVISNAVKFTPAGGHVSVVVRFDARTREVLRTCADSGIGIPASDQPAMFGKFFRASNATLQAIPGTGLGMSVIKGIVDAHGGAIALTSRESKGTIVTIRLPEATLGNAAPRWPFRPRPVCGLRSGTLVTGSGSRPPAKPGGCGDPATDTRGEDREEGHPPGVRHH